MLALQDGCAPKYFRDSLADAEKILSTRGLYFKRALFSKPACCKTVGSSLGDVYVDVMALCHLLNHDIKPRSIDLLTYQEIILSIFYRLLRFRSLNDARDSFDKQTITHVGLVLFVMTIFLHHGTRSIIDFQLASSYLEVILNNDDSDQDDDVVLWALLIGGIWTANAGWIIERAKITVQRTEISTWSDVQNRIQGLPWINVLHNKPGEEFWHRLNLAPP